MTGPEFDEAKCRLIRWWELHREAERLRQMVELAERDGIITAETKNGIETSLLEVRDDLMDAVPV